MTAQTFTLVLTVEDDRAEESWEAFPVERRGAALNLHRQQQAMPCKCEIHTVWNLGGGSQVVDGVVLIQPTDPRVGVTFEGKPVFFVGADAYTWLD